MLRENHFGVETTNVLLGFMEHPRIHSPKHSFLFFRMGGPEPDFDSVKPEASGRAKQKGVGLVGKCPDSRCSDYAVENGLNPGGVHECVFIIRL